MNYVRGKFRKIIFENNTGFKIGLFKVLETDCKSIKVNKTITYTGYFKWGLYKKRKLWVSTKCCYL